MSQPGDDGEAHAPLRVLTVEIFGPNDFTVREADRYCDRLCWDEMLGTLAELTHPRLGEARYRMRTAEEYRAWEETMRSRAAALEQGAAEPKRAAP